MSTLLYVLALIVSLGGNPYSEECQVYTNVGYVVEVNQTDDVVVFVDDSGFEWSFTECEDWQVGDGITVMMYNNETMEDIFDDVVVSVIYHRYI